MPVLQRSVDEVDGVHLKAPSLNKTGINAWSDRADALEALNSPMSVLMKQWDDLEHLINTMRTPNQTVDELIASLENIDFSSMLDQPSNSWASHYDDEFSDDEDGYLNQNVESSGSCVDDDDNDVTISVAFTMEDIQNAWGDDILAGNLLNIPKRERLVAKTIVLNLLRVFVPGFDVSCKMLSQSHLMKLVQCANRIIGAFLPNALYRGGDI